MKRVVTAWEAIAQISLGYLPMMAANPSFKGVCDQEPFKLPEMQEHKSLTLLWRSFSRWGRDHVAFSFAYRGCQYFDYVYSLPSRVLFPDLLDQKLFTLHWRSFSRWGRVRFAFSFLYKGCQHFHYVYSLPNCDFITWLTAPNIIDAPLTLILPWAYPQYTIISSGGIYH